MQIKDNITATSNPKVANLKAPIKMVKLRAKDNVSKQADKLMESTWNIDNKTSEVDIKTTTPEVSQSAPSQVEPPVEMSQVVSQSEPKKEEIKESPIVLPLTSEETIRNKKDLLGIEAYKDIESSIVNLASYQNARRLRVNEVVVGNANRERNINGIERIKQQKETPVTTESTVNNNAYDFSNLESINNESFEKNVENEEESKYDNVTKLDEWLNKETAPLNNNSNDQVLDEVNKLQAELNDNASSLATQKEILEQLRQRIANNELLVQARKKELEEENLNVTRELKDVLKRIKELTDRANEQEAFLGISNDEDLNGKSHTV